MGGNRIVLKLEKINKSFPGVKALTDVDFSVQEGEVHALVGENGAGKSTLMKIISGAYTKDSGSLEIGGKPVEIQSPKHSEMLGVSIIYQELNLIRRMTVAENIFLGRYPTKNSVILWKQMNQDALRLFEEFGIRIDPKAMLGSLSMAQRQIVEIVKAASINAKVVIMDEPTSSLSHNETEVLFRIIRMLKEKGTAVVFITHRLDEIYAICDRMTILRDGCYINSCNVCDVSKDEMIAMMIGRQLTQQFPVRDVKIGAEILEAKNLSDGGNKVKDVSFSVRAGEVLGFAGLVGAGRTEVMRMIFGADPKISGEIYIDGKKANIRSPRHAIASGIGFVTENRKEEGLFLNSSVRVNTVMVALQKILRFNFCFDFRKEKTFAEEFIERLRIVTPSSGQRVLFLSGGNQQKVVLAKWLFSDSRIIIFDEPTRGIDVGAKREIYEIINKLTAEGKAVIVISSDMEEIMGICDRILVLHEGLVTGEVHKNDFSQHLIAQYAVGGVEHAE